MSPIPSDSPPTTVCEFYRYQKKHGEAAANRLLLGWLSSDDLRAKLYADMIATESPLHFTSNASQRDEAVPADSRDFDWGEGLRDFQQPAVLLVHPNHIEPALAQSSELPGDTNAVNGLKYANTPYRGLGGFSMLGLDSPAAHDAQRKFALEALQSISEERYDALATLAFKTGALAYLKSAEFDLAAMAQNIAMRYVCMAFGFAPKDLPLLEACAPQVGRGLEYLNMGRHFVFEPGTLPASRSAVAALAERATEVMSLYAEGIASKKIYMTRTERDEKDELEAELNRLKRTKFRHHGNKIDGQKTLEKFVPIMQWMVSDAAKDFGSAEKKYSLAERGLIAAVLVSGSVTNIQNAICIVMAQWMKEPPSKREALKKEAISLRGHNTDAYWNESSLLQDRIKEAMRCNPPAAYIPRRASKNIRLKRSSLLKKCTDYIRPNNQRSIPEGTLILIGLGGAGVIPNSMGFRNPVSAGKLNGYSNIKNSASNKDCPFSKAFGGAPLAKNGNSPQRWVYTHSCPGMMMSMYLIAYTMRQLILLPGLSEIMNPKTRAPYGLEKRWGVQAVSYRMRYQRERLLVQTPLQTVLPIKTPVDHYSQQLRQVLRLGAPFIEKVLRDANHVHFASFMFMDNDSKLVLFTMYDGDFDSYIAHFAREFGYLFDRFFSCIAVQPPMPIREHPDEFVDYLKQFSHPPVEGYYFSAYPKATTAQIVQSFGRPGELDWQTERRV